MAEAEEALLSLDAAAGALPNIAELCAGALRLEAIASARLDGHAVTLDDLLFHEAAPPASREEALAGAHAGAGVIAAAHHLHVLRHGRGRLAVTGVLTADIVMDILAELADGSRGAAQFAHQPLGSLAMPPSVTVAIARLERSLDGVTTSRSTVTAMAMIARALEPLSAEMEECAPLARIGTLLGLCGGLHPWRALIAPSVRALRARGAHDDPSNERLPSSAPPGCSMERASIAAADTIIDGVAGALCLMERAAKLTSENERRIGAFSQAASSARLVHLALQADPVTTLPRLLCGTGLHTQAATSALHRLRALGIVREVTGRRRHRVFRYDAWIALLNEPLSDRPASPEGTL